MTDAVYHTHLLGPIGVGKSTVLLALALDDAAECRGLLLLDPKGDLATDFVARLPEERAGDVVVLDPTNPCPVGFNPLAGPPELAVVTAEAVLGVLAELFRDSWGIRTADVLSAALLTLARIPQATLVWLVPLLTNPAFRRRVLALAPPDPLGTDVFWQGYEVKPVRTQAVEVAPVLNKLRQLMLRPGLRAMLGQAQPRFGLTDLLERRRIVVVNLNQDRVLLGEDLVDESVLDVNAARVTASEIADELLVARRRFERVRGDTVEQMLSLGLQTRGCEPPRVLAGLLGVDDAPGAHQSSSSQAPSRPSARASRMERVMPGIEVRWSVSWMARQSFSPTRTALPRCPVMVSGSDSLLT